MTGAPADANAPTPIDRLRRACEHIRAETQGLAPRGVRHDDADSDVGTFATDDAIGFDPMPMLAVMQETRANYAVFGQVAGIMHGSLDPTGDLDLLWDGDSAVADRMAQVFVRAGVVRRDALVVPYLCLDDLIMMRRAVAGPKHTRRVQELEDLARGTTSTVRSEEQ